MMSPCEVAEIRGAGEDITSELRIDTYNLDSIENSGVNLHCVHSSEFMVGKQTNFNGPVTIINCTDGNELENFKCQLPRKEDMVTKDKLMGSNLTVGTFIKMKAEKEKLEEKTIESSVKGIFTRNFLKIPVFAWSLILFLILAGFITLLIELYAVGDTPPDDVEVLKGNSTNHTLFRRWHWKAAPEESSVLMKLPVTYVIVSSTGSKNCTSLRSCGTILQSIQKKQMKKSRSDIYSNFLVSSDGSIFEGRGWEKRSAFQGFANNRNIEINCIGEFVVYEHPTKSQINAIESLIEYGIKHGKINETYYLLPANATGIALYEDKPTIGKNLYEMIKDMRRFEPEPYSLLFQNLL